MRRFWDRLDLTPEERARAEFSSRRFPPVVEFLASTPPSAQSRVLDLGGGIGSLSVALHARYGGRYELADFQRPSEARRRVLHDFGVEESYGVRLDQTAPLEGLSSEYDLILLVEVLEHLLVNPLSLFAAVHDRLRPDGLFLVTTPNMARVRNRLQLLRGRSVKERGRYPTDGSPGFGHVMEYTLDELEELLGWEDFEVVRSTVTQNVPRPRPSRVQKAGVRLLRTEPARRLRLGDEMIVLARKRPRTRPRASRPGRV